MSWKKVKLGDILSESKIESKTCDPDKRITVRLNLKGVEKRPFEKGVEGATKYFVRKAGQFIYGKQNLFKGAFGIIPKELDEFESSSDIPTFDISNNCLPEWLFYFLKQNNFYTSLESIATGTGSRRIQPKRLYEIEIPLPSLREQKKIIESCDLAENNFERIDNELKKQQNYLQLLRQTILQEAVQGKLNKRLPKDEPATELLKRIKVEKEKLIKAGKLKKEKELSSITEGEIPFELPEGWVWCRLYEVGILKRGKSKHRPRNDRNLFINGTYPFIQTGEVSQAKKQNGLITSINGYYNEVGLKQSEMQKQGTLCITIAANIAEYGFLNIDACVPDSIVCFNAVDEVISKYVSYFINVSKDMLEQFAPSTAQKNINLGILSELKFPLPPLAEQHHIVAKVQQLQQQLSQLETQVQQSREYAQQLLQSVLREAFEEKGKVYEMGEERAWMVAEE